MNEEEKAIVRVERLYKFSQDVKHTAVVLTEDTRCLGIVLNLLQQEKEKNKKLEEVIDLMAEDLVKVPENDYMTDTQKSVAHFINLNLDKRKETVKQYYFKKARGEEDD